MAKRNPRAGLFTGYWTDGAGKKLRRIRRDEYPELYRLHRKHTAIRLGVTKPFGNHAPWMLGGAVASRDPGPAVEAVPPNVYRYGNLHPGAS